MNNANTDDNERIERCFWCGRPKNGEVLETEETVKKSIIRDYVPCNSCKELIDDKIHVIGVTTEPIVEGMFPIFADENGENCLYPTGSMFVATENFVKELLSDQPERLELVLEKKLLMFPEDTIVGIIEELNKRDDVVSLDEYIENMDKVAQE